MVQDAASYQRLIELTQRVERMDALGASVEKMRSGKGISAEEVLTEMRQILVEAPHDLALASRSWSRGDGTFA